MNKILTAEDVWNCKLAIVRIRQFTKSAVRKRSKAPEYPATLGDFTLGELRTILMRIYEQPFREQQIFDFPSGRYIVTVQTSPPAQADTGRKN